MGVERMRGGDGVWGLLWYDECVCACVCVSGCCSGLREGGREVAVCAGQRTARMLVLCGDVCVACALCVHAGRQWNRCCGRGAAGGSAGEEQLAHTAQPGM